MNNTPTVNNKEHDPNVNAYEAAGTSPPPSAQVGKTLQAFFAPDEPVELRYLTKSGAGSGVYTNHQKFINDACIISNNPQTRAVWFNLNEIPAGLASNTHRIGATAIKNEDIMRRKLILVDVEAKKPEEFKLDSATDEEKREANAEAQKVGAVLTKFGIPYSMADSGNGFHLPVRVDLPCSSETDALVRKFLESLQRHVPTAKIDTSVHDRGRVTKLYGTQTRKGRNLPERPWRRSALLQHGDPQPVPADRLQKVIDAAPRPAVEPAVPQNELAAQAIVPDFDMRDFLAHYGIDTRQRGNIYPTDICIMAGRKHSGDPNKSGFYFDGLTLGWNCFSDDCGQFTIGDVIKKLNESHPRYPKAIWTKTDQPRATAELPVIEFSEDALALEFTAKYGSELRYTAAWGRWSEWDGTRWKPDDTRKVFDLARRVCRDASSKCEKRLAVRIAGAATVAAVERLGRSDRRHAATVEQWDADPWLLNTPSGIVDLRTGALRPGKREDYMTKITSRGPGGDCPRWREFLARITDRDEDLQCFLQRMAGYALTGITREHALFFLYGKGANGKSVFINAISGVMGDYAKIAPIETFIASASERHPTDLAGLQGARLITSVETEDGRRWAESKLKALTGGDRIAARFMRQDFFEFSPQFKLVIAGNHKPGLRTVDEAMRRRLKLLPFTVTIPAPERDLELTEKLRGEWAGILQWMIEGCLSWQREGLNAPAVVTLATEEYLASEDILAHWLEDCCATDRTLWTSASALFASWRDWCDRNEEHPGSQKRFSEHLESRGFSSHRTNKARGFDGIRLVTEVTG